MWKFSVSMNLILKKPNIFFPNSFIISEVTGITMYWPKCVLCIRASMYELTLWMSSQFKCGSFLSAESNKFLHHTLTFRPSIHKIYECELIHYYDSHTFSPIWFLNTVHNTQRHYINYVVLLSFQFVVSFFIHFDNILRLVLCFIFISSKMNERMNNSS